MQSLLGRIKHLYISQIPSFLLGPLEFSFKTRLRAIVAAFKNHCRPVLGLQVTVLAD